MATTTSESFPPSDHPQTSVFEQVLFAQRELLRLHLVPRLASDQVPGDKDNNVM